MATQSAAPSWVTSWYPNDPVGLKIAVGRYGMPVTTAAEREAVADFRPSAAAYPCDGCGRFAFPKPMHCYWCIN